MDPSSGQVRGAVLRAVQEGYRSKQKRVAELDKMRADNPSPVVEMKQPSSKVSAEEG